LNSKQHLRSFTAWKPPRRHAEELPLNISQIRRLLVDFVREETRNAGFKRGIIGLSGGVDSSVSAFIAAEALGSENVFGVIMPYKTSNPQSQRDAELVANQLEINSEVVEITPMVDPLLKRSKISDPIRAGNVMARERMIVLYDLSSREKALVIGTSNKTEICLGYGTLFGDTACAINPLGDLYKTQVWQLAESLSVPKQIIEKPPSADLWEGQTDEGELGFSYKRVDQLLHQLVDEQKNENELMSMGFDEPFIRKAIGLMKTNEFKRRAPLIAKIS
jgi:NAD+ synthase